MPITKNETIAATKKLIEIARRAPSVHNIQPWQFRLHGNTLQLLAHPTRRLHAGDPTSRGLWISLGIIFETLLQTAAALGMNVDIAEVQTDSLDKPIATLKITSSSARPQDAATLEAIKNRYTYRGALSTKPIEPAVSKKLSVLIQKNFQGVEVLASHDKKQIGLASRLTKQGLLLAFSSPEFRRELSQLIHPNWTKEHTGLPGFVLKKSALSALWEKWSIRFNIDSARKAHADAQRVGAAPLLLFIATTGDISSHWFVAGRAYALATIELTRLGLAHSTVTAPIEAADYHKELETALHTKLRLQSMIIVGHPPEKTQKYHPSPRLTVDELLTGTE